MDTPEMAQLYRRYQRCERLAKAYTCVLDERTGDPLLHLVIDPEGTIKQWHARVDARAWPTELLATL